MKPSALEGKSHRAVLDALKKAQSHKMSPAEIREQRVSFILGSVGGKSRVTRERVNEILCEKEGGLARKSA